MSLLIEPNIRYEESYKSLIREFGDEELIPFPLRYPYDDFDALINKLRDNSIGKELPEGFVPNSTYWLIDENDEIIGVSNLRHELTDHLKIIGGHIGFSIRPSARKNGYGVQILGLTLAEALKKGIGNALVTCDKRNEASARAIIKNGGVFDTEEYLREQNGFVQRYWINLNDFSRDTSLLLTPQASCRRFPF